MNSLRHIRDLAGWAVATCGLGPTARPDATALGVVAGEAVRLRLCDGRYVVDGPVLPGARGALFIQPDQALAGTFILEGEAMLHGIGPARIELSRRCPFPLEQAAWGLMRKPEVWVAGAPWMFAALPQSRLAALRQTVQAAGGDPGPAFTLIDGLRIDLSGAPRTPVLPLAAAGLVLIAAGAAALSISIGAQEMETAAEARLSTARSALDRAEAAAAAAATAREDAAAPIRAAAAVHEYLTTNPPAGAALVTLTAATGDEAHLRRLRVAPGRLEGEFIAPDAAALAAQLGAVPPFSAARLKTAAQTDAATGLQAATLDIAIGDAE